MLEVKNVAMLTKQKKIKPFRINDICYFRGGYFLYYCRSEWCRKTTLLSLLAGLDTAVKGTVLCNGEDITKKG